MTAESRATSRSLVFLDVDGVLVTERSLRAWKGGPRAQFDREAVATLNRLTDTAQAAIVLSSMWRLLPGVNGILRRAGVKATVIGHTPVLGSGATRGAEIRVWLARHVSFSAARFVILDDDADMEDLAPYFVQTRFKDGLRLEHVSQALRVLGHEVLWGSTTAEAAVAALEGLARRGQLVAGGRIGR